MELDKKTEEHGANYLTLQIILWHSLKMKENQPNMWAKILESIPEEKSHLQWQ